jgi:hypothetical protein
VAVVRNTRGFTVIEAVVALAVLTLVATSVLVGEGAQLRGVARSFDELAASRAAAARLEELAVADPPLVPGESTFPVDLPGCRGVQIVRRIEPGLYEVTARVEHDGRRHVELVTRLARKEPR